MSMAVVSHPALSPEWSFPSPINPFDAPTFSTHVDLEHTSAPHIPIVHKRRAHEIDWDDQDMGPRVESRAKKAKTLPCLAVDPHQLHRDCDPSTVQVTQSTTPSPPIEDVISIIVDALTSNVSTTQTTPSNSPPPEAPITVLSSTVPAKRISSTRAAPTSPLSESPNRIPFVRKVIGGSCAGKREPRLYRWVLCKNHFLR
jgi:hypothetical protein